MVRGRYRVKFGLVLGAGGFAGWVFHSGVLRAMADDLGIEPGDAEMIVGTSAGSSIGAAVRAGVPLDRIHRAVTTPPSPQERAGMRTQVRAARKTVRPLSPKLARHALPGGRGAGLAVAGMLPPGWFPTDWLASFPGMDSFDSWPAGLWIPTVRSGDGHVVVFGKDRVDVAVHVACEASSAVPAMFRPMAIGGALFIDGGVASSTHASLLVEAGVDLAIISAPMSKPTGRPFARHARRRLADELTQLEAAGIETIVMRPSIEAVRESRGFPRRNREALSVILDDAVAATRAAFSS